MRTLALLSLAAAAAAAVALPAAAAAQPRAGHSWGDDQRAAARHGGAAMGMPRGQRRAFRQVRRFNRGDVVPRSWWGPQFHVQHWQHYGFPQPRAGHRWIRYHDDALLIDAHGRVMDARYGFDWDRYGDRWSYDDGGLPVYVGDGDYYPDERDYGYAGRGYEQGGWDYSEYGRVSAGHPSCAPAPRSPCAPAPYPARGYGSGYGYQSSGYGYESSGYGYGYGCCATMTITETVVESGGASYVVEEVIEEEEVVTRRAHRPVRRAPPPRRPIRGERG